MTTHEIIAEMMDDPQEKEKLLTYFSSFELLEKTEYFFVSKKDEYVVFWNDTYFCLFYKNAYTENLTLSLWHGYDF
jgi:hypothetical protein